jgi:hypothetical protein
MIVSPEAGIASKPEGLGFMHACTIIKGGATQYDQAVLTEDEQAGTRNERNVKGCR